MTQVGPHSSDALRCRVQAGNAFYVDPIGRDLINARLRFEIVGAPNRLMIVRTLTFTEVQNFQEVWHEEQTPDLLEQILFLDQHPEGSGFRYTILLGQSYMEFYSETEPELIEAQ